MWRKINVWKATVCPCEHFRRLIETNLLTVLAVSMCQGLVWCEAGFGRGGAPCQTSDAAPSVSAWSLLHSSSFKSHSCKSLPPDQNFGLDYHTFQHMVGDCPSDFLQLAFNCCNVSPSHSPYPIIISSVRRGITAVIGWRDTAQCGIHVLVLLKFMTNTGLWTEGFPKQLVFLWSILIS